MKKLLLWLAAFISMSLIVLACGNSTRGGDSQTNWLKMCTSNSDCGTLECVCGHCTRSCTTASDCIGTPVTTSCHAGSSGGALALCGNAAAAGVCLVACDGPASCETSEGCVAGACVPMDTGAPNDSGTGAASFCWRWVEELAAYIERCGCGAAAAQTYRDRTNPQCETGGAFGNIAAAVEAGDLVYNPQAADALIARLYEPDPVCVEEGTRAVNFDSLEVYSYAGVFTGIRALGSACTMPVGYGGGISDCREGVCAPDGTGGGVCIALVGIGEECDASGDDNFVSTTARLCFDQRPADPDGEYESAFDSVACVLTAPGATTRVCARDLEDGQPCNGDEACQSGRCDQAACAPKLANGEPCDSSGDCLSGACHLGITPSVCGPLFADGEACFYADEACTSGACLDDASGGVCGPAPSVAIGDSCSASYECISQGHGGSRDGVCQGDVCVADVCVGLLQ